MDNFDAYREQIDAYIQGRMEAEQRLNFEQILAAQPELKAEVDLLMSYQQSFKRKDLIDFKSTLDKVAASHTQSEKSKTARAKKLRTRYWLLAAAVISILVATVLVFKPQAKQAYQVYAQVDVPFGLYRSDTVDQIDDKYLSLESQLTAANMERSQLGSLIKMIEDARDDKAYQSRHQEANEMLLARAYLLYGKPKKTLDIIDDNWPSDRTSCSINYYRAVALLELDRKKEAKLILDNLKCLEIDQKLAELLEKTS